MSNQPIKACKEKFSVITKRIRGKSDGSFYLKDLIRVVELFSWNEGNARNGPVNKDPIFII